MRFSGSIAWNCWSVNIADNDSCLKEENIYELYLEPSHPNAVEPMDFIEALKNLQSACGGDNLKMSEYGIAPEEFPIMAKDAKNTMGGLFFCDRIELTEEDVVKIYEKSYR